MLVLASVEIFNELFLFVVGSDCYETLEGSGVVGEDWTSSCRDEIKRGQWRKIIIYENKNYFFNYTTRSYTVYSEIWVNITFFPRLLLFVGCPKNNANIVKHLAQGHNCHNQDLNPHSVWCSFNIYSLIPSRRLIALVADKAYLLRKTKITLRGATRMKTYTFTMIVKMTVPRI